MRSPSTGVVHAVPPFPCGPGAAMPVSCSGGSRERL
jgi:hypothetical protein